MRGTVAETDVGIQLICLHISHKVSFKEYSGEDLYQELQLDAGTR